MASYPKCYKMQCQYMKCNDCYWFAIYAYNMYVIIYSIGYHFFCYIASLLVV